MSNMVIEVGSVLLVESEPSLVRAYREALASAGFRVGDARDGAQALDRADREAFDLTVVDLAVPKLDGITFVRRLREREARSAVVVLCDAWSNEVAIKATEAGAAQCLLKPVDPESLRNVARAAVRRRREARELLEAIAPATSSRDLAAVSATEAKNEFGTVLETALRDGAVLIKKHDDPKALLVSMDRLSSLLRQRPSLTTLTADFDALLGRMQTAESRAGMRAIFEASPQQLGNAAVRSARRKRSHR